MGRGLVCGRIILLIKYVNGFPLSFPVFMFFWVYVFLVPIPTFHPVGNIRIKDLKIVIVSNLRRQVV